MNISKIIVWTRPDGGISICSPCISKDDPKDYTEAEALARALAKDVPADAQNVKVLDRSKLPEKLRFRNAWRQKGDGFEILLAESRKLVLTEIRRVRARKLDELDKQWLRAKGQKKENEAEQVEAKRQALRDLPQTANLERFNSIDELDQYWPDELEGLKADDL